MATSNDVTLPKGVKPVFPDRCVVCNCEPDSTAKIVQNSQNWLASFFMPILMLFGWSRVEFPICSSCKLRFYLQRWGRTIVSWIFIIVVIMYGMPFLQNFGRFQQKLIMVAVVFLAMLPYISYEVFWPRYFDTTAGGKNVTYEFKSVLFAIEFNELNEKYVRKFEIG